MNVRKKSGKNFDTSADFIKVRLRGSFFFSTLRAARPGHRLLRVLDARADLDLGRAVQLPLVVGAQLLALLGLLLRLDDHGGVEQLGEEEADGSARLLDGSLYTGLTPTGESAGIGKLLAPVVPTNIFCIGLNYREHAAESGMEPPEKPILFMKPTSSLQHPGVPVRLPACQNDSEVDYECELAAVIGERCRDVSETDALQFVIGYTGANDVSARHWQMNAGGGQWIRGKSFLSLIHI